MNKGADEYLKVDGPPLTARFTLTLALSHRGRGDCWLHSPIEEGGCPALLTQYLDQPPRDLRNLLLLTQPDIDPHDLGVGRLPRCGDGTVTVAEFLDKPLDVFTTGDTQTRALERHAINTWNPPTNRR